MVTAGVQRDQRFSKRSRCPICGGAAGDQRGKGKRCHGFTSADGEWAHCTREEYAFGLEIESDASTYAHKLCGPCKCGVTHGADESTWNNIEAEYYYRDERGRVLFRVQRTFDKQFPQSTPKGDGTWASGAKGVRRVLYRLPELLKAELSAYVFIVEGEKDVETIRAKGGVATCSSMGARSWTSSEEGARVALADRNLVIVPDADAPGRALAEQIAASLADVAACVRVLELPRKDVTDWFDADPSRSLAELQQIAESVEPRSSREVDPWARELEKALADVRGALSPISKKRRPLFLNAQELHTRTYAKTPWLVDGLITSRGTAVIGGEPKAIKTWLATEIAVAIATSTPVLGTYFAQPGTAVCFYAEDLDKQVRNRQRALLASRGLTFEALGARLHCEPRGEFIDVLDDEHLAWIVASCRMIGKVDVLFLDPLRDIHSGEEDKSDSMRDVMRRLRLLGELLACTIVVVHHTAKLSESTSKRRPGQRLRGSGAIHGSIDAGIYLSEAQGGDASTVFVNHLAVEVKGAKGAGVFDLELRIRDDEQGEAVRADWMRVVAEPKEDQDSKDDERVFQRVRELAIKGEQPLSRNALREAVPGVADKRVRAALARLIPSRLALRDVEHNGKPLKDRVVLANAWAHQPEDAR